MLIIPLKLLKLRKQKFKTKLIRIEKYYNENIPMQQQNISFIFKFVLEKMDYRFCYTESLNILKK